VAPEADLVTEARLYHFRQRRQLIETELQPTTTKLLLQNINDTLKNEYYKNCHISTLADILVSVKYSNTSCVNAVCLYGWTYRRHSGQMDSAGNV